MEELNIILNSKPAKGLKGDTILQAAKRYGIEIPTLCNDPRIEPYSSCYVCVVEVEGVRTLQPACSTRIAEGMRIETENERVKRARKIALDLLLSNHYADCMAPCKQTCPAGVDVQGYISLIEKGLYKEAVGLIKEVNPLPAICGRVCVRPCEVACRRNLLGEGTAVGIDYLKRFAADQDLASDDKFVPEIAPSTGKKVAIIGAGPGGLSAAWFLQTKGHQCDIFEAAPAAGGWLRYGIPEYRLPNDLLQKEVDNITELGANIHYNKRLGDNLSYRELKDHYDATILTIGSQVGTSVGCEGDDAEGVYPGIIFLKNMEVTGQKHNFKGKTVAVVGGGNTAMDCCRTSIRCGADKVIVVYRRTEKEMPANPIEIHESKLEGVEYMFLTNPVKINKDGAGKLKSMTLIRMELGEPDASGRRRPVPVEGSEFDVEVDIILAAIGQKTEVNFINDINEFAKGGELKINRWGDIDADKHTLQTGIPGVFAAGDGVTGPATLIEAIAQARVASRSCDQFLRGENLSPLPFEFLSKRDNFREQKPAEYAEKFQQQLRQEMPVLDPAERFNFHEVELGYASEEVAKQETARCLECGCVEYFTCDLKKHATTYGAEQKHFEGEYKTYEVDFSHPLIEIDNNKCILCSRCIRICREVVGAAALGLVNRGFQTYVAPAMGNSLLDTPCESCGMCISACPTAAISENVLFKPGPVKFEEMNTIDPFTSEGFDIKLLHRGGFVMRTEGVQSDLNPEGNIGTHAKFGYHFFNDPGRITQPMLKRNGGFVPVGFDEALALITQKIKDSTPQQTAFFAGGRLTNEELYQVQKLARGAVRTNNIHSFLYLGRGKGYEAVTMDNVPFLEIRDAKRIYLVGENLNRLNPLINHLVFSKKYRDNIPVELITTGEASELSRKVDHVHKVSSYYSFFRAVNHFMLSQVKQNQIYIDTNCEGFETYRDALMEEDYGTLLNAAGGCSQTCLENIGVNYNIDHESIVIYSLSEVSAAAALEIRNLALISGKPGKHACGVIAMREKNNAQGLFDMGIHPGLLPGSTPLDDEAARARTAQRWNVSDLGTDAGCMTKMLDEGQLSNLFIFGEDPVGTATDADKTIAWMNKASFRVVCDYAMTETAQMADLLLPATLPIETDGSFTNSQRYLRQFEQQIQPKPAMTTIAMLNRLLHNFGLESSNEPWDILAEALTLLPEVKPKARFQWHESDTPMPLFDHGCDAAMKRSTGNLNQKLEMRKEE
ncbi:MAG: FAD-dependent oxidoreductase [Bacteroidales bacterium]